MLVFFPGYYGFLYLFLSRWVKLCLYSICIYNSWWYRDPEYELHLTFFVFFIVYLLLQIKVSQQLLNEFASSITMTITFWAILSEKCINNWLDGCKIGIQAVVDLNG